MVSATINVNDDFSHTPGGRKYSDGKHSAEEFRETLLMPALRVADEVRIILDGTCGFAASFLEEAFGGAARNLGKNIVKEKLVIISDETPGYIDEVNLCIDEA